MNCTGSKRFWPFANRNWLRLLVRVGGKESGGLLGYG